MASHANLHVGSLPDGIDEALFRSLFEGCGSIVSTKLFADRGFGFVKMSSMEEAQRAIEVVNRATVLGSTLTVKLAAHDGTKGHAKGDGGSGKDGPGGMAGPAARMPGAAAGEVTSCRASRASRSGLGACRSTSPTSCWPRGSASTAACGGRRCCPPRRGRRMPPRSSRRAPRRTPSFPSFLAALTCSPGTSRRGSPRPSPSSSP
ncbi:unnamed protein product, partial [Prorocentrum cordatum]